MHGCAQGRDLGAVGLLQREQPRVEGGRLRAEGSVKHGARHRHLRGFIVVVVPFSKELSPRIAAAVKELASEEDLGRVQHLGATTAEWVLGSAGRTGILDITFRGPLLPPGVDALAAFAQPIVADVDGSLRLGSPSSILIVDASFPLP